MKKPKKKILNRRQTESHKARLNGRGAKGEDKVKPSTLDAIKAMRRGGREAEMELLGPGFAYGEDAHARHSSNKFGSALA